MDGTHHLVFFINKALVCFNITVIQVEVTAKKRSERAPSMLLQGNFLPAALAIRVSDGRDSSSCFFS